MKYVIGVDIGGTAVIMAVFTTEGTKLTGAEIPTRTENNGEHILADVSAAVRELVDKQGISLDEVLGIGVGVPGPVPDGRTTTTCVNLGWGRKDVATFMESELGLPCWVENDANLAALGESWQGSSQGTHSSVLITIGTGIGGGIIINGKIVSGFLGGAGEVGHMPVYDEVLGQTCSCGSKHCLELGTAAPGLVQAYFAAAGETLDAKGIFAAAKLGEPSAVAVVDTMQQGLGKACAMVGCVVNPEEFVIGGGVSKAGQFLLSGIKKYYEYHVFPPLKAAKFVLASLGNDAGVYGAAKLVLENASSQT